MRFGRRLHVDDPRGAGGVDQFEVVTRAAAQRPVVRRVGALDHRHQRRGLARGEFLEKQETVDGVGVGRRAPDGPGRVVLPLEDRQPPADDHALFRTTNVRSCLPESTF